MKTGVIFLRVKSVYKSPKICNVKNTVLCSQLHYYLVYLYAHYNNVYTL